MARNVRLIPKKEEALTVEERQRLASLRKAGETALSDAQEAALKAEEAKTELDYYTMQLRHKYNLRVGDSLFPDTGKIERKA
jgi:hypothetical protein